MSIGLNEFAKQNKSKPGYTAWREKSPENAEAWSEAIKGFESGLEISVIVKWLKKEHNCPLSYHTIRTQLNDSK